MLSSIVFAHMWFMTGIAGAQIPDPTPIPDLPGYQLKVLSALEPKNHPGFGQYSAPLGDINGDGIDDLAISTLGDTTFIFPGGDPTDKDPDFFVLGGAYGLTAGDFNGDGLTDIATSMGLKRIPDYESRGTVRIYLHTGGSPPYREPADRIITGDPNNQTGWNRHPYSGVISADLNGDGADDLLYPLRIRQDPVAEGRLNLILGGDGFLTRPPYQFLAHPRGVFASFAEWYLTGDLNGDGCDDLIIFGYDRDTTGGIPKLIKEMSVYLGNRGSVFGAPEIVNRSDSAWVPDLLFSNVSDINGDGYADLIDASMSTPFGGVHMFLGSGRLGQERRIWDNDSIPNTDLTVNLGPRIISPVGDMTGDGVDDCIVGWGTLLFPTGTVYYVYPSGPNNDWKTATGYIGLLPERDGLREGAYPAGDVDNDGYEDMCVLGKPGSLTDVAGSRVWIFSGSPRLRTEIRPTSLPRSTTIRAYPQPLLSGQNLNIEFHSDRQAQGRLILSDLLGRIVHDGPVEVTADLSTTSIPGRTLSPGIYLVQYASSGQVLLSTTITVN